MDEKNVKLKNLLDEHSTTSFPTTTSNDKLQDIKADLTLYDGHIVGLVSSYLKSAEVDPKLVAKDRELDQLLAEFVPMNEEDKKSLLELKTYKHKIDELVELLSSFV